MWVCWGALALCICGDLIATSCTKLSKGFNELMPVGGMLFGNCLCFFAFPVATHGIDLALAYCVWTGIGTFSISLISRTFFGETFTGMKAIGMMLVLIGIFMINFGDHKEKEAQSESRAFVEQEVDQL